MLISGITWRVVEKGGKSWGKCGQWVANVEIIRMNYDEVCRDETITRIAELKQQVFARIPPPTSTAGQQRGSGSNEAGAGLQGGAQTTPSRQTFVPQPVNLEVSRFQDTGKSLRQRLKKQNEQTNTEECLQDEEGELRRTTSSSPSYPHLILILSSSQRCN